MKKTNTNVIGADLTAFFGRRLSAFTQVRPAQTKTSPSRLATAHGNASASTLEPGQRHFASVPPFRSPRNEGAALALLVALVLARGHEKQSSLVSVKEKIFPSNSPLS